MVPHNHQVCHILWRSKHQVFQPRVMLALCSLCEDKDEPKLFNVRMAPGLLWKPALVAVILPLLTGSNMKPRATSGLCTGSYRLILSGVILMNQQLLDQAGERLQLKADQDSSYICVSRHLFQFQLSKDFFFFPFLIICFTDVLLV